MIGASTRIGSPIQSGKTMSDSKSPAGKAIDDHSPGESLTVAGHECPLPTCADEIADVHPGNQPDLARLDPCGHQVHVSRLAEVGGDVAHGCNCEHLADEATCVFCRDFEQAADGG